MEETYNENIEYFSNYWSTVQPYFLAPLIPRLSFN